MKKVPRIGGYFLPVDGKNLLFESANVLKSSIMMMFIVLAVLTAISLVVVEIEAFVRGEPSLYFEVTKGEDRAAYLIFLFPFILPIIWLFLPPTKVVLDRSQGVVHHRQGKRKYDFPWNQIHFKHQWIPTKTGGSTLFTLIALPPFPEELNRLIEKKARPAPGQTYTFQLGSFDVKNPEHGQAIFAFLDAWMRSNEPAESLYESMVRSGFDT
jgi:hypothetical protein